MSVDNSNQGRFEKWPRGWRGGVGFFVAMALGLGGWWAAGQLRVERGLGGGGVEEKLTVGRSNRFEVRVRPVNFEARVLTGATNRAGAALGVSCSTCHAGARPNLEIRRGAELDEFHQGLRYEHGAMTCLSCHDARDYDRLHLADGSAVEFQDVMRLCGQCHGTAMRDYERGSHGGMAGYWDLSRGPRLRNSCVHCHDVHSPKYPGGMPVSAPRDRGVAPTDSALGKGGH